MSMSELISREPDWLPWAGRLAPALLGIGLLVTGTTTGWAKPPVGSAGKPPVSSPASSRADKAFQDLLEKDDAAQKEVDAWIREDQAFREKGGLGSITLNARVQQRLEPVKQAYKDFIQRYPSYVPARLAYGSFLDDQGNDAGAYKQWEKARKLNPKDPAAWNNLANYYGHHNEPAMAFAYYEQAMALNSKAAVYYRNLASAMLMYPKDAAQYFRLSEDGVNHKALDLYQKAFGLDPKDFLLATDLAQTYYTIKPFEYQKAHAAWEKALTLASSDMEKEGVYLHLARVEALAGKRKAAMHYLNSVTNQAFLRIRQGLEDRLATNRAEAVSPAPKK